MLAKKAVNGETNYPRNNLAKPLILPKKSQRKDKALYFENKKNNSGKKAMKLKEGMEEKEKKEKNDAEEKERLVRTAGQVGLSTKTADLESNIYL